MLLWSYDLHSNQLQAVLKMVMLKVGLLASLLYLVAGKSALRGFMPDNIPPMKKTGVDPGSPLFLTPYIENKQFDLGNVQISPNSQMF